MANRLIRGSRLVRWVRNIRCANCLNQPFPIATMEILFSHKFLRCDLDLGVLPKKCASRNLKDCLPLEEWGLIGFKCSSKCLIHAQRRSCEEGWNICCGAEGNGLLASIPKQNVVIIEIPHPCLLVSRSLQPMLW